jgi:PleD family two-component response regulator
VGDRFCLAIDGATAAEAALVAERIAGVLTQIPLQIGGGQSLYAEIATGTAELAPGDDAAALVARAFARLELFGLRQAS